MATSKRMRQKAGRAARLDAARKAQERAKRNRTVRNIAVATVVLVIAAIVIAAVGGNDSETSTANSTTSSLDTTTTTPLEPVVFTYGTGACPAMDGSSPQTLTFTDAPQQCIDPAKTYTAVFDTNQGIVKVALDTAITPGTANNFVVLSLYHYYDNTKIFRSNTGIGILQGGSPHTQDNSDPGPGYNLPDEGGIFDYTNNVGPFAYEAGDLVMARAQGPNSGSAQFFFGASDAVSGLDSQGTYVKFGHVSEGLDVLEKILGLHVDDPAAGSPGEGGPSTDVIINKITIEIS